jgi:hypothetical protein
MLLLQEHGHHRHALAPGQTPHGPEHTFGDEPLLKEEVAQITTYVKRHGKPSSRRGGGWA